MMLIQDLGIRIIHAATGQLIRQLTLDPTKDYQPRGVPSGCKEKARTLNVGSDLCVCLETSHLCPGSVWLTFIGYGRGLGFLA